MKNFIDQRNMKRSNAADVFNLVRERGRLTRREIADLLGMSWGAVSTITARLIDEEYLVEVKGDPSAAKGRTPFCLEVNGEEHFAVGVDVNRSGLSAVLVNLKNHIIGRWTREADFSSRDTLTGDILSIVREALEAAGDHRVRCIGVAMQGVVDSGTGISYTLRGCRDWENINVSELIGSALGIPTYIEHDPNYILYASRQNTAEDRILLRIDKGIGMAATLGGRILTKSGLFEIGHTCAVPDGRPCMCGRRGCLEQYASMRGLAKASGMDFPKLAEAARGGEMSAMTYFDEMAAHLAHAIANASRLLCVENIILCGDMCRYDDLFLDKLIGTLRDYSANVSISFSDVGNAPLGAALIAIDRSLDKIDI